MAARLVAMAEIVGVHGVKGAVKLRVLSTAPERLTEVSPLVTDDGRTLRVLTLQPHGNTHLATLEGVSDRTAAERLKGLRLFVARDRLPALEPGAYYYGDLEGLAVRDAGGADLGTIARVVNFGAGDLIEIKPPRGATYFLPFTQAVVPEVDLEKRIATVVAPEFS